MKVKLVVLVLIAVPQLSVAQSSLIKEAFRLLPPDVIFDLTIATRDSLLEGKTYYPADNDSLSVEAYNYGISTELENYMYISSSYETGQRGIGMIELRSFPMKNGDTLLLVSQTGGVPQIVYSQVSLSGFVYTKNKELIPYKKKIIPAINENIFFKPGIPDSVKKEIINNSNLSLDLSHEKIMLGLNSWYISKNKKFTKWLNGDVVYFDRKNDHFIMGEIKFQFPD